MPFLLVQGVGVGIVATIGFSYAVSQLGSAKSSIIGALSPGITTLLAVPIFDEPLSIAILCGISLTITGVILSNRV
jgi:drug/metabolite transporter (DMT)-like permease